VTSVRASYKYVSYKYYRRDIKVLFTHTVCLSRQVQVRWWSHDFHRQDGEWRPYWFSEKLISALFAFKLLQRKWRVLTSLYARVTVKLLYQETPEFISPDLCPPNSPVEYRICWMMQECVYAVTSDLKQRLIDTWASISQNVTKKAISQWRKRLRVSMKAKWHHFEHPLN